MQTIEQRFQHETLELIVPKPSFGDRIRAALYALQEVALNSVALNQEPKITVTRDRAGQSQWNVYDPINGYTNSFVSENEVRIWLESRYH